MICIKKIEQNLLKMDGLRNPPGPLLPLASPYGDLLTITLPTLNRAYKYGFFSISLNVCHCRLKENCRKSSLKIW